MIKTLQIKYIGYLESHFTNAILVFLIFTLFCWQPARAKRDSWGNSNPPPYQFSATYLHHLRQQARHVTIYRDAWGTPHVHGHTDADAVFGLAYATAEDRFRQRERPWAEALGRSAELEGPDAANWDILIHALQIPHYAREEYDHASPRIKAIARAFADGINYFLATHPDVHPRVLTHFEPWYVFAFVHDNDVSMALKQTNINLRKLAHITLPKQSPHRAGSNMWAVGPSKSASGYPMLFINPHDALHTIYEAHLISDDGLNVSGATYAYYPIPVIGHNTSVGWSQTVNEPDIADIWKETFNDPSHPLRYRYGKGYKTAETWTDSIRIRQKDGTLKTRILHLRKTIHGPILAERNGHPMAVRIANIKRGGYLEEFYAMGKSHNLSDFRKAISIEGLTYHNLMYADTSGHIYYIYNGAIPRRNPDFNWSKPLDGSDPATQWQGYHKISELPQVLDPPSGWMQNTNSSPFFATANANPDSSKYPSYMVAGKVYDHQIARSRESRRLLSRPGKFSLSEWKKMAFDTHFIVADEMLLSLIKAWKQLRTTHSKRAEKLRNMVEGFQEWDHNGSISSPETTWFCLWRIAMADTSKIQKKGFIPIMGIQPVSAGPLRKIRALEAVRKQLIQEFGTIQVPWGKINRLQRPEPGKGMMAFSDSLPSLPVPGADADFVGDIFAFYGVKLPQSKYLYGVAGDGYVSVVQLSPHIKAWSVVPWGESNDPKSSHYFDQAHLYARGKFKRAWFTLKEVKEHAAFAYHPGEKHQTIQ